VIIAAPPETKLSRRRCVAASDSGKTFPQRFAAMHRL